MKFCQLVYWLKSMKSVSGIYDFKRQLVRELEELAMSGECILLAGLFVLLFGLDCVTRLVWDY